MFYLMMHSTQFFTVIWHQIVREETRCCLYRHTEREIDRERERKKESEKEMRKERERERERERECEKDSV